MALILQCDIISPLHKKMQKQKPIQNLGTTPPVFQLHPHICNKTSVA